MPDYFAISHEDEQHHITPEFGPIEDPMPEADDWDPESFDQ